MPTFTHDGIAFNYRDVGRGLPFVFLHGLGNDVSQPLGLLPRHEGVRLLSLDFRSHGDSWPVGDLTNLSIPQFADDVHAFLLHLGLASAVLGGTSLGSAVALNFVLRYAPKVNGLVLSRPAWLNVPRPDNLRILGTAAACMREHGAHEGAAVFSASDEFQQIEQESKAAARSLMRLFDDPRGDERIDRFELLPRSCPFSTFEDLAQISSPTLIIGNDRDPIHPRRLSEAIAASIPAAQLRIVTSQAIDQQAHRAEVHQVILEFLHRFATDSR
jgi:pimeloyl-ACP methyl ester carboxylesterase